MAADNDTSVRRAADRIDYLLSQNAFREDAVVVGDERTLIIEPLAVDYRVSHSDHKVIILNVWMIGYLNDASN